MGAMGTNPVEKGIELVSFDVVVLYSLNMVVCLLKKASQYYETLRTW